MTLPNYPNACAISDALAVGGQPSAADFATLAESGYDTIVNLRPEAEMSFDERAVVEALGMTYVLIPVGGAGDVSFENAAVLDAALASSKKAVVHCASGNRVGALFALRAAKAGASADDALQLGVEHGLTGLRGMIAQML